MMRIEFSSFVESDLEVNATRTMIDRVEERFDIKPTRLVADTAYGAGEMLDWIVNQKHIEPHVPVFDKSERTDGTFGRSAFKFEAENNRYICPAGKVLHATWRMKKNPNMYRASQHDCLTCPLKSKCYPNALHRKIERSPFEPARDIARAISKTAEYRQSRKDRKEVEILFAHLKRILHVNRLRLRGLVGQRMSS